MQSPTPLKTVRLHIIDGEQIALKLKPKEHHQKVIVIVQNSKGKVLMIHHDNRLVLPSVYHNQMHTTKTKIGKLIGKELKLEYLGKMRNGRNDYLVLGANLETKVRGTWISPTKIPKDLSSFARKAILKFSGKPALRVAA